MFSSGSSVSSVFFRSSLPCDVPSFLCSFMVFLHSSVPSWRSFVPSWRSFVPPFFHDFPSFLHSFMTFLRSSIPSWRSFVPSFLRYLLLSFLHSFALATGKNWNGFSYNKNQRVPQECWIVSFSVAPKFNSMAAFVKNNNLSTSLANVWFRVLSCYKLVRRQKTLVWLV